MIPLSIFLMYFSITRNLYHFHAS